MSMPIESMPTTDENRLRDRIVEEESRLSGLSGDLRAIDAQLEGLGEQRNTYELLERTCGALEQLEELGAAELFWGDGSPGRTAEHINAVRGRADAYLGRIGEIEQRRSALVDEIKRGQDVLDILEADLYDLKLEEEEKNSEWVVERELTLPVRQSQMPWSSGEDDRRLRKSLSTNLLLALILGIVFPMIDLPLPDLQLIPEVPERFAKLIEKAPPPPPPQIEEPEPQEAPPEEPIVAEELPRP